jgi:small subunit ribosomal protein S19
MARIFTYRGMQEEQLRKLPMDKYMTMIKARQRRALKRQGLQYRELLKKIEKANKAGGGKTIRTRVREAVILPAWIGTRFAVHNGKEWKELEIRPDMLGHRLGEFVFTTKHVVHSAPGIRATRGSKFLAVK